MKKGFTLLEILLVVAAIGILAAIVIVAINPNRQLAQARNAERFSELNSIQKALEQYLIDNAGYPDSIENLAEYESAEICLEELQLNCATGTVYLGELIPTYLSAIPVDEGNGVNAGYIVQKRDSRVVFFSSNSEIGETISIGDFSPIQEGLIGWFDAGVGIDLVGNEVDRWNNRVSDTDDFFANTATRRPDFEGDLINGKPTVTFEANELNLNEGEHLTSTITPQVTNGQERHYYMFEVSNFQTYFGSLGSGRLGWVSTNAIGNFAQFSMGTSNEQNFMVRFSPLASGPDGFSIGGDVQDLNRPSLVWYRFSYDGTVNVSGEYAIHGQGDPVFRSIESTHTSPAFTGTITSNGFVIGARQPNNDNYVSKQTAEVLIYERDTTLTADEIGYIESYLLYKYNL